jgi:Flp pilus assembly protein TadG
MMRRRLRSDRGSAAVELAILFPAVLLLLFASIQTAAWFLARNVAISAAQEAVTAERAYNAPNGAGQARAAKFLDSAGDWLVGPRVTVVRDGDDVSATVTGRSLRFVLAFDVSQTAHGRVERFSSEERP